MAKWQPQPDPENEPLVISTNALGARHSIPTPSVDEPDSTPPRVQTDPSAQSSDREVTAWDNRQLANSIIGPFDAFTATVDKVFPGTVEPETGYQQGIAYRRGGVHWKTNNEPQSYDSPPAASQPTVQRGVAIPFPPRHDQPAYIAAEGDTVTVISGRDGRAYYLADELPFFGVVVSRDNNGDNAVTDADKTERFNGGAGNVRIKVRRQKITGAPPGTLGDLLTAAGATIDYDNVTLQCPVEQAAGVRCGDCVMVTRRGLYYFATPAREVFVASIVSTGPDDEIDFTEAAGRESDTNHYWVKELVPDIAYGDGTGGASANEWTGTLTARALFDADGGRICRWVDAVNINEPSDHHDMAIEGKNAFIFMFADPTSGEIWYGFTLTVFEVEFGKLTAAFTSGTTIAVTPCTMAGVATGGANVTLDLGFHGPESNDYFVRPLPQGTLIRFMRYPEPNQSQGAVLGVFLSNWYSPKTLGLGTWDSAWTVHSDTWDRAAQGGAHGVMIERPRLVLNTSNKHLMFMGRDRLADDAGLVKYVYGESADDIDLGLPDTWPLSWPTTWPDDWPADWPDSWPIGETPWPPTWPPSWPETWPTAEDTTGSKYMVKQLTANNGPAAYDWLRFAGT